MKKMLCTIMAVVIIALSNTCILNAQSFEEIQNFSDQNSNSLVELKNGQYGPIDYYTDEGSMGGWVRIQAPNFFFSSERALVVSTQKMFPRIFGCKVTDQKWVLVIQNYSEVDSENNTVYLIDGEKEIYRQLFISGNIEKAFATDVETIVFESQVDKDSEVYTKLLTIVNCSSETTITEIFQKQFFKEVTTNK